MLRNSVSEGNIKSKRFNLLFLLWLLTLPFGAKFAPISFGFFTLYPNLILGGILALFGILTFRKWTPLIKGTFAFLSLWLLSAVFVAYQKGVGQEAIFDIRSLVLQVMFFCTLIGAFYTIEREPFRKTLITGLRAYLGIILLSGVIEFLTGNHFQGTTTDKFMDLPVGNFFYAPMFIYDNHNDYLCYAIFTLLALLIVDSGFRSRTILINLILVTLFFFADYADANFGKLALIVLFLANCGFYILQNRKSIKVPAFAPYFITIGIFLTLFFTQAIFWGPKYSDSAKYRINDFKMISKVDGQLKIQNAKEDLSKQEQDKLIWQMDSIIKASPEQTANVRLNLILNGIDFIKDQPIFGIGPGEYRKRHIEGKVNHYTHTLTSAHNFPIEIISQFGIFGWIYFLLLAFIFVLIIKKWRTILTENNAWLIAFFGIIPLLWIMPSSYLYLDINWMLVPLLLIQLNLLKQEEV